MNNTKQTNNNTENENSLSSERKDVTCSEERTELSPSSGSDKFYVGIDGEIQERGVPWWKTGWFSPERKNCPDWWYEDHPSWSKNQ